MDNTAIEHLLRKSAEQSKLSLPSIISSALEPANSILEKKGLRGHLATVDNLEDIEKQVAGLALYEKEPESVHVNREHYRVDGGFDGAPALYYCLLLQETQKGSFHGMSFFYFGFDLESEGGTSFLYLEDLFIEKEYRGRGCGGTIMRTLANIAQASGSKAFVWQALEWDVPALGFYNSIGAKIQEGLLTSRFNGTDHMKTFIQS